MNIQVEQELYLIRKIIENMQEFVKNVKKDNISVGIY